MQIQDIQQTLATTTVGSTAVSFFVSTLPVIQWLAAAIAAVTGTIYLINLWRNRKKK